MRARPYAKFVNIYGTKGMIHTDLATEICTLHKSHRMPGIVTKVVFNLEESVQLAAKTTLNTAKVAFGSIRRNPGLLGHLREFYASIEADRRLPVSGEDGKNMVEIMEQVAAKIDKKLAHFSVLPRRPGAINPRTKAERKISEKGLPGKVMVTGATGFLGYHLVQALSRCGANIRALVHNKDRVSFELERFAEITYGDLRDQASIEAAMKDARIVCHCAAVTKNNLDWETHHAINIAGTETVFKAALKAEVDRVIHISSVIVYGLARSARNGLIDESALYSQKQNRWAHYLRSKVEADKLAFAIWKKAHLPVTILRLGILYGPGGGRSIARGLIQVGPFRFTIGAGRNRLPFIYIGNAVDAILLAIISPTALGQAYNVVDEPQISVRDAIQETAKISGERIIIFPVPPFLLASLAKILEWRADRADSDTPPKLSNFVVRSACRDLYYDTRKANEQLGWSPEVALRDGLKRALS
jgi:nucleoside-diphosphate-sugar epimerase